MVSYIHLRHIVKPTDRPPESLQSLDADNQIVMEMRWNTDNITENSNVKLHGTNNLMHGIQKKTIYSMQFHLLLVMKRTDAFLSGVFYEINYYR